MGVRYKGIGQVLVRVGLEVGDKSTSHLSVLTQIPANTCMKGFIYFGKRNYSYASNLYRTHHSTFAEIVS